MSNDLIAISIPDIEKMAAAVAKSQLFGMKTQEQAMALMLIAHAEGRHPALAARDYDIIQGRPAKKAEAMLRDFLGAGGKVEWEEMSARRAAATFSHPQGGTIKIEWTIDMAMAITTWSKEAGKMVPLGNKDNWRNYPRQMLRSRVVSEGVRAIYPTATSGMYVPEEVRDFDEPKRPMKDVTPPKVAAEQVRAAIAATAATYQRQNGIYNPESGEVIESATQGADAGPVTDASPSPSDGTPAPQQIAAGQGGDQPMPDPNALYRAAKTRWESAATEKALGNIKATDVDLAMLREIDPDRYDFACEQIAEKAKKLKGASR